VKRAALSALLVLAAASAFAAPTPRRQPAPAAPAPPADWIGRGTATLEALDKVNAQHTTLTVPVGSTASYEALSITVKACLERPPNQAKDSAAYLVIQDPHVGAPGFDGWMFASAPEVSMLEHPIYDVRVLACH
jgi:hypothetical protein